MPCWEDFEPHPGASGSDASAQCRTGKRQGMGTLGSLGPDAVPYRTSKAALNALTLIAALTCGPGVKLNAVCPGWVRTDIGGAAATRSLAEGASGILWAARLPHDGLHGGLFRDGARIEW